jgi:ubiquinone/menaquinone biosynthesis C-methylase UbiE
LAPANRLPFPKGSFAEARAVGFLHHIPREEVIGMIRETKRCLQKGGQFIVLEDVWPKRAWTRPLAWLTRKLDRGRFMRTEEELLKLFKETWPGKWEWRRYTYTFTGSELLYLSRVKD